MTTEQLKNQLATMEAELQPMRRERDAKLGREALTQEEHDRIRHLEGAIYAHS